MSELGLYSMRARYYDPSQGRFLSRDEWAYDYQNPVELNRYVYTANNPVNGADPSGYATMAKTALRYGKVAEQNGGPNDPGPKRVMGALMGGLAGAAMGAIIAGFTYSTVIADCPQGEAIQQMGAGLYLAMSMATGAAMGAMVGYFHMEIMATGMASALLLGSGAVAITNLIAFVVANPDNPICAFAQSMLTIGSFILGASFGGGGTPGSSPQLVGGGTVTSANSAVGAGIYAGMMNPGIFAASTGSSEGNSGGDNNGDNDNDPFETLARSNRLSAEERQHVRENEVAIREHLSDWTSASFEDEGESIAYHYSQHGRGRSRSVLHYLRQAQNTLNQLNSRRLRGWSSTSVEDLTDPGGFRTHERWNSRNNSEFIIVTREANRRIVSYVRQ